MLQPETIKELNKIPRGTVAAGGHGKSETLDLTLPHAVIMPVGF